MITIRLCALTQNPEFTTRALQHLDARFLSRLMALLQSQVTSTRCLSAHNVLPCLGLGVQDERERRYVMDIVVQLYTRLEQRRACIRECVTHALQRCAPHCADAC